MSNDDFPTAVRVSAEQYARLTCDDDQPTSCACECHEPKPTARAPHPSTMIGRK